MSAAVSRSHRRRPPAGPFSPGVLGRSRLDAGWAPRGLFRTRHRRSAFPVNAVNADGTEQPLAAMALTRGARHMAFLAKGRTLVFLRGDIQHKNLWDPRIVDRRRAGQLIRMLPSRLQYWRLRHSPQTVAKSSLERVRERSRCVVLPGSPAQQKPLSNFRGLPGARVLGRFREKITINAH